MNKKWIFLLLLVVLVFTLPACKGSTSNAPGNAPDALSSSTGGEEDQPAQPVQPTPEVTRTTAPIPNGWKVSQDTTGKCQVAAPPEWQLGVDFFLEAGKTDPGPMENAPGEFPPSGLALWGGDEGTPMPEGHYFQVRTSRVIGEQVCSVWRIKADTDFTDGEKSQMEQVGTTLQMVRP